MEYFTSPSFFNEVAFKYVLKPVYFVIYCSEYIDKHLNKIPHNSEIISPSLIMRCDIITKDTLFRFPSATYLLECFSCMFTTGADLLIYFYNLFFSLLRHVVWFELKEWENLIGHRLFPECCRNSTKLEELSVVIDTLEGLYNCYVQLSWEHLDLPPELKIKLRFRFQLSTEIYTSNTTKAGNLVVPLFSVERRKIENHNSNNYMNHLYSESLVY